LFGSVRTFSGGFLGLGGGGFRRSGYVGGTLLGGICPEERKFS